MCSHLKLLLTALTPIKTSKQILYYVLRCYLKIRFLNNTGRIRKLCNYPGKMCYRHCTASNYDRILQTHKLVCGHAHSSLIHIFPSICPVVRPWISGHRDCLWTRETETRQRNLTHAQQQRDPPPTQTKIILNEVQSLKNGVESYTLFFEQSNKWVNPDTSYCKPSSCRGLHVTQVIVIHRKRNLKCYAVTFEGKIGIILYTRKTSLFD